VNLLDWAGLAATTAGAALLYTLTGFGFAVLAAPLFLLFADPPRAIQLVIIISTALSFVALPGLWRAIAPGLMLRLGLGSLAVTVGIPTGTWLSARILIPFAFLGALAGRPLGDRVGADAFAILAILLLTAAGLCTLAAAAAMAVR
jgi:uncharacterized membrane protein YfcA